MYIVQVCTLRAQCSLGGPPLVLRAVCCVLRTCHDMERPPQDEAGMWRLAVFPGTVAVYFLVPAGGVRGALCKCAPVVALAWAVRGATQRARMERAALLASCVGDALLASESALLFPLGMLAFGAAHACRLRVLSEPAPPRRGWLCAALCATALYVTTQHMPATPAGVLRVGVPLYALLLSGVTWRACAHLGRHSTLLPSRSRTLAAVASVSFLLSDTLLGLHMFRAPLQHEKVLVMSTYYLAQLCFATSTMVAPC